MIWALKLKAVLLLLRVLATTVPPLGVRVMAEGASGALVSASTVAVALSSGPVPPLAVTCTT